MATFESIGQGNNLGGGDSAVTVTAPTGIEVGDLLVAGIYGHTSNLNDIVSPTGWTEQVQQQTTTGTTALSAQRVEIFTRIAELADTTATDYTFTTTDGSTADNVAGFIVRLSNWGIIDQTAQGGGIGTSVSSFTATGYTPTRANCLNIAFIGQGVRATASGMNPGISSFATDNPTWTQRGTSLSIDVTNNTHGFVCFTATRAEQTATGDITLTITNDSVSSAFSFALVAISPQVNGSITQETKVNAYAFSPISNTQVDATLDEPTLSRRRFTQWTNETKPSTTWTNKEL